MKKVKKDYKRVQIDFIQIQNDIIVTSELCDYHTGWTDAVIGPFDVCETRFGSWTTDRVL